MVWFRSDLRLHDNEALTAANEAGSSILPGEAPEGEGLWGMRASSAQRWFRSDLRLRDNHASTATIEAGSSILPGEAPEGEGL